MILTKCITIKICSKNIQHFKNKGYNVKIGEIIDINVDDLSPQSNKIIVVQCDKCGKIKKIKYQTYMLNIKFGETYYACSEKCAWYKNRKTNLERYGVDVVTKNADVKNKYKETCMQKYGVANYSQTDEFKDKYKNTMLKKYGVENGFQSEDIKAKSIMTNILKYGTPYNMQRQEMKDKYLLGDKNYFYIHGHGGSNAWISNEAKVFKSQLFKNDRKCAVCNEEIREMQIHHLYSRNTHSSLTFNKDNVVIVCKYCHKYFHDLYGYGNNTKEQFYKFLVQNKKSQTTIERISKEKNLSD